MTLPVHVEEHVEGEFLKDVQGHARQLVAMYEEDCAFARGIAELVMAIADITPNELYLYAAVCPPYVH